MQVANASTIQLPGSHDTLQEVLRQGAQRMLTQAMEAEVAEWIGRHAHLTDERGRRQVVRNGYLPERKLAGDWRRRSLDSAAARARSTPSRGAGTLQQQAVAAVLAQDQEHRGVDPVPLPQRNQHWRLSGSACGDPRPRVPRSFGHGALGFWKAIGEIYPTTREQRCWVHKTANVVDKCPKAKQAKAKAMIHEIWMSETKEDATKAFDAFLETYQAKYPKATECLAKDRDVLLTFYDFPAEHWRHLRTTNPIESTFATIRLRHRRTKGSGSRITSLTMMFKLAESASKRWRLLNGSELMPDVIRGVIFQNGLTLGKAAA